MALKENNNMPVMPQKV